LQEMIFLFPGSIKPLNAANLQIKPLITTGQNTGYVLADDVMQRNFFGGRGGINPRRHQVPTREEYILAVHVKGTLKDAMPLADKEPETAAEAGKPAEAKGEKKIDVVLVADMDVIGADFFELRNQAGDPNRGDVSLNPDNVTFVLNSIDELADDQRFISIRNRRPAHRTLETVDKVTEGARREALENREKLVREYDDQIQKLDKEFQEQIKKLQDRKEIDPQQMMQELAILTEKTQRQKQVLTDKLQKERDRKMAEIERSLALKVRDVQNRYKMWAVFLPPIPPLLIGLAVFFNRRAGEREGVARSRLR